MPINAGELDNRVEVQAKKVTGRDASLGQSVSWITDAVRWAKIESVAGREIVTSAKIMSDVTHLITIRFFKALTTTHRFKMRSRIFNIISITGVDESKRELMVVQCKEVV